MFNLIKDEFEETSEDILNSINKILNEKEENEEKEKRGK